MNNKLLFAGTTCILLAGGALGAYQLVAESRLQREQISSYEDYVAQLQEELESFADRQIAYETEINNLRREQVSSQSHIETLENELEIAEAQIDPDVIQLEQQIRERLIVELQQVDTDPPPRADLLRQLNALDPDEMRQLMTIQSMYGGFLRELDVDERRMNVIVNGLSNMVEEQNQLRIEAIEQLRNNPDEDNARELRQRMLALSSPEAQLESLSYLLTDAELDTYQAFQLQQQQDGVVQAQTFSLRGVRAARPGGRGRAGFIGGSGDVIIQNEQGTSTAIQILRTEPPPQ